ncbi:hypothetical protein [Lunatibacter salilacus]|uniref:hypothetical protein n=1 Tax=Lunatibacter salilacus TaxID=2483804 RepID=UPI00131CB217|nr:hypothetical protein [Lunatibacter salilacus]
MKSFLVLVILFFGFSLHSFAQHDRSHRLGFGLGPSVLYGNGGIYREFKFNVLPVATVDFSYVLHPFFDIKATMGWQMMDGGDYYNEGRKETISRGGFPYGFKGNLFFADIMPIYHFNPDQSGYLPSLIKVYTGIGLGFFHSQRTDERYIFNDSGRENQSYSASGSHFYIPFRLGIFKSIKKNTGEIGLEGTMLFSPFGEFDGDELNIRTIKMDIATQFQFYYRIPLSN